MSNIPAAPIDNRVFYSRLWRIALPISLQHLMLALVAAGDALMLGQVEQVQMTAVSLATQIQFIQNIFFSAINAAFSLLAAQYFGKRDLNSIRKLFHTALTLNGFVCLVFFLACELVPETLMRVFASDEELIRIGADYLRIAGWSYLLTGISECYLTVMKVTDHVSASALCSASAVVLNIIFNAIFIFGLLGMPRLEARGAALATLLARVIQLLLCLGTSRKPGYLRPDWRHLFERDPLLNRDFRRQCLPLLGASLLWGIGFTSHTAIMGHLGVDAAAANSVVAVVCDLNCCLCNGVANAAGILVGNELGAGNLALGKAYGIRLKNLSWFVGLAATAIVLALTPLVVRVVQLTDLAQHYLTGMMLITSVYMIGRCVNTIMINGVLDGGGDTIFDLYSLAIVMWGVSIPLSLLGAFVFHWSPLLVYASICLDEVGKIPWVLYRLHKYYWVRDLTIPSSENAGASVS